VPQNFLCPQRDQPLLLPVGMREWLPEDDLVYVVLDAVAAVDLEGFRRRYRADGHGRAAFDLGMMVGLLLYAYSQGERSSRVIEKRCVRDVAYRMITGGLRPDHATIARFRARHEEALGGLFSQVLRLLAAEGMVALGVLSLDGTKLAGSASQKANKTLPQIEKLLAEAAAVDAAEDAQHAGAAGPVTPRALARRAERRERLAAAAGRRAAEDAARRDAQRAKLQAWEAAAAAGKPRGHRPGEQPPRTNHNNTEPRANITDPDVRVMRSQRGYVPGYNGQLMVTCDQVIVGAMLSQHPVDRTLLHPLPGQCQDQLAAAGVRRSCAPCSPTPGTSARRTSPAPTPVACGCSRRWPETPPGATTAPPNGPGTWTGSRPPPGPGGGCSIPAAATTYKMRARTVEPVFGQLKTCQKLTMMSRRGLAACKANG
jgi:transposase